MVVTENHKETIMKLCECGCGEEVSKEGNRFLFRHGHGNSISEETKKAYKETWAAKMFLGYTSPLRGKSITEEHRKNISSRRKLQVLTEERNRKIGLAFTGDKNPAKRPEVRKKLKESSLIAHQDPTKYRNTGQIKGYYFSTKNNDNIPYRSSYELEYLKQLESDPLVATYEYESLWISVDLSRYTKPDFLVHYTDGHTELVEVKADWCLDRPDVQSKIEAMKKYAEKHNWIFRLVTEKDLGIVVR